MVINRAGANSVPVIEGANPANVNDQSNISRIKYFDNSVTTPGEISTPF